MTNANLETVRLEKSAASTQARRWRLTVVTEAGLSTLHALPEKGEVVIGRADDAQVRIDDLAASRRHAKLELGPAVRLVDLGSANGTTFRGKALGSGESVEILAGDAFEIGTTTAVLQLDPFSGEALPFKLLRHAEFLKTVEATKPPFALVRLQVIASPRLALEVLSQTLGDEVVATNGPGEFEILAPGKEADAARSLEVSLTAKLNAAGAKVRSGIASAPRDGTTAEALIAACARPASAPAAGFVVRDDAMAAIHRLVDRIAPGSINVLLLGENGTGKEVLATEIHRRSRRADGPMVRVNCAAIPENLVEGELFGYLKGAFTGADRDKEGLLESGKGGTVFLDEVGELPLAIQPKLLRVLEERKVQRLGSAKETPLDVRFIFATNRDLEAEVARGAFRADLFYRLNGISIVIPPLRDRLSEVEPLANTFAADLAKQEGVPVPKITADAVAALRAWHWPGNVRELKNVMARAVLLSGEGAIDAGVVAEAFQMGKPSGAAAAKAQATEAQAAPGGGLKEEREAAEKRAVLEALEKTGGNQTKAAELLGVSRRTLVNRLQEYGLTKPRRPQGKPRDGAGSPPDEPEDGEPGE